MSARAATASVVLFIILAVANAQDAMIYVDVSNQSNVPANIEARRPFTPQLREDLQLTKTDAALLYTEFAGRAGTDLRNFLTNFTGYADKTISDIDLSYDVNDSKGCRAKLESRIKKIEHDAKRAASYSGDSHHKFLLGHMIVFRMHLNKSEDYIKKCDNIVRTCGTTCESTPRVKRWLRLASEEINRVRDDLQHSRKSYRDLVSHARRKLNHLRKAATTRTRDAIEEYRECLNRV